MLVFKQKKMAGFTTLISKTKNIPTYLSFRKKNVYGHEQNFKTKIIGHQRFII